MCKTNQRTAILKELKRQPTHPTAYELYRSVRKRMPRISLGTVYRNLEQMSEAGVIQKLETGSSPKRFDGDTSRHYHVRCANCGRVCDVEHRRMAEVESMLEEVRQDLSCRNFLLEFNGTCLECDDNSLIDTK